MTYINPFYYNLHQRFPAEITNSIFLNTPNNLPNALIGQNPYLLANMLSSEANRNLQIKEFESLNFGLNDPTNFNLLNQQFLQASMLAASNPVFQHLAQYPNFCSSLGNICHINNNYQNLINQNFFNYLQNNNFLNLPHDQTQVSNNCKTANFSSEIYNQQINKQYGILKEIDIKNKLNRLSNDFSQQIKENKNEKKIELLNKKKKRFSKKKSVETSEDESSASKIFEKNSTSSTLSDKKKNMRNLIKFEEKNFMLGTQEEYEKFFKNDRNKNEFTEDERNLIQLIDNPRRKKKKLESEAEADFFKLSPEKIKQLNEEVKSYIPFYEKDLEQAKQDKKHDFMMNNFPETYQIQNFYIHVKKNIERKKDISEQQKFAIVPEITKEKDYSNLNSVWKSDDLDVQQVDNFLFEVEKIWPIVDYKFSQEFCLELLKYNNNDFNISKNQIRFKDSTFRELIKNKKLNQVRLL
jgi:hypothetical protein